MPWNFTPKVVLIHTKLHINLTDRFRNDNSIFSYFRDYLL